MRIPTPRVRELRVNPTEAERTAWYLLRDRRLEAKFHRQCRIENWVVDFYCFEHRLAIELDGGVHSQPRQMQKDAAKGHYLRTPGVTLLRIPNGLVLGDPEEFVRKIQQAIKVRIDHGDTSKRPLTRPATAGESAVAGHPLPKGEGCGFTSRRG